MSLKQLKEQQKALKEQERKKDHEIKENLINIIRDYPQIWAKGDTQHKDREATDVAWDKVAAMASLTKPQAKKMWKYLRDQFSTNFHAVSKKKSGQEYVAEQDVLLVKWPFFSHLMFLKDVIARRKTSSNIGDDNEANEILMATGKEQFEDIEDENLYGIEENVETLPSKHSSPDHVNLSSISATSSPVMNTPSPTQNKTDSSPLDLNNIKSIFKPWLDIVIESQSGLIFLVLSKAPIAGIIPNLTII